MECPTKRNSNDSLKHNTDLKLLCLNCGYELTGLVLNRCPECGKEFNRTALIDNLKFGTISKLQLVIFSLLVPIAGILMNAGCLIVFSSGNWDAIGWLLASLVF